MLTFYASRPHYIDHLAPIWRGMDPEQRGKFVVAPEAYAHARLRGLDVEVLTTRRPIARYLVVASLVDLVSCPVHARVVFVEHGAGQSYNGLTDNPAAAHGGYAGGKHRERAELFLCPNEAVADANLAAYPDARAVVVGCPKLDDLMPAHFEAEYPTDRPVRVAFTWHWPCALIPECGSAWQEYRDALADLDRILGADVHLIGTAHPRFYRDVRGWYRLHGFTPVEDFDWLLRNADVLVGDNSSALYEFAAVGKPVVVVNAREYRRDVHHGLRFWSHLPGVEVNHPGELAATIGAQVDCRHLGIGRRQDAARAAYGFRDGTSTARAVEAVEEWATAH